jgi:uncharacterized protein
VAAVIPPLRHSPVAAAEMRLSPIKSSWVIEGEPVARVGSLGRTSDGVTWTDVWDCTAGTFHWHYGADETVHIIDGEAIVTDADGQVWTLHPGDVVTFRAGTRAHWHVPAYVRKVAFCRRPLPMWIGVVLRCWQGGRYYARQVFRRLRGRVFEVAVLLEVVARI